MSMPEEMKDHLRKYGYKYLPVRAATRAGDFGRWILEELLFAPSKVNTYVGYYRYKAATRPSWITKLFLRTVSWVIVTPFFVTQALVWQVFKTFMNLWLLITGRATYMDKKKLFTKNK